MTPSLKGRALPLALRLPTKVIRVASVIGEVLALSVLQLALFQSLRLPSDRSDGEFLLVCLAEGAALVALFRSMRTVLFPLVPFSWVFALPIVAYSYWTAFPSISLEAFLTSGAWERPFAFWFVAVMLFSLPVEVAHRRARQGLSGQDVGEAVVAGVALAVTAIALLFIEGSQGVRWAHRHHRVPTEYVIALSALGIAALSSTLALATSAFRALFRSRFVTRVERGEASGFRVEQSLKGKVLIRVTRIGEGYRVADLREELMVLESSTEVSKMR